MAYIGIDGGGTKTDAVMLNQAGHVVSVYQAGPTNPHAATFPVAMKNLADILDHFLADDPLQSTNAICLGLAGVFSSSDQEDILHYIRSYYTSRGYASLPTIMITTDAEIALMCTLEERHGIVVISGTGSIVYGITPDGEHYRVGGWGHLLGDQGSGYDIGLRVLQAVMKSYDLVAQPTMLTELIVNQYQLQCITELRDYVYKPHIQKKDIAAFAKIGIEAAKQCDPIACEIIVTAATELAGLTQALRQRDPWLASADIGVHGSIFEHSELFRETFLEFVQANSSAPLSVRRAKHSPAHGAALLALNHS